MKSVWIPRETEDLDQLVEEREQTAARLERAEILLIKRATIAYRKAVKAGHPEAQDTTKLRRSDEEIDTKESGENSTLPKFPFEERKDDKNDSFPIVKEESKAVTTTELSKSDDIKKQDVIESPQSPRSPLSPALTYNYNSHEETPTSYGPQGPPPDINGSVAAQWIPASHRPTHRPLANYGRSTDTIKWTRTRLKELSVKINKLRKRYRRGHGDLIPAVFIEFHTQLEAQIAYQTLAHHRPNHMRAEVVGVRPREIVWPSLYMGWRQRTVRSFLMNGFVAVMVVFWAIPCAIIGMISQIKFLTKTVPFLGFINKLPSPVLGLISGLLPAVALALLMSLVPMIMRCKSARPR